MKKQKFVPRPATASELEAIRRRFANSKDKHAASILAKIDAKLKAAAE